MLRVLKNNVWSDDTYDVSLLHYQLSKNSAVNRNLACVINNWKIPNIYELIKSYVIFCMINELLIWFKKKITDNCFNFIGE